MSDEEKQALITAIIHGERSVESLDANEFLGLLNGLYRMYNARIWNCVDASGKWDTEWRALSDIFGRCQKEITAKKERA